MCVSVGAERKCSERQSHGEDHKTAARKTTGSTVLAQTVQLTGYETARFSPYYRFCVAVRLLDVVCLEIRISPR